MSDNLAALLPSIGVAFLFVVVIRAILHADRRERAAQRELDGPVDGPTPGSPTVDPSAPDTGPADPK